ncbi:DUF4261 domain-containing protein [Bacillus ndiopicus]|uniref:DUF4261 domain-containing protein n=1 Tax=Bacillus ndiopicus TaxID=1347368 RepID=UPI000694ED6B|nr:DUF4261 domain-containing protein [Bacillus ndiopicus]
MEQFETTEEHVERESTGGPFVSFVLLDKVEFSVEQLVADLQADWNITIDETDISGEQNTIVCTIDDMLATVSLMPAPIPGDEAIENAKTNFRWPDAVAVTQAHQAHLLVAVLPHDKSLVDAGVLMVKLCASALKQPHATAINTVGSVLAPDFYIECAHDSLQEGLFPIMNLVFFGLYSRDEGKTFSGYTFGMSYFDKLEMEILDSTNTVGEVLELLMDTAIYVITSDVTLLDGETIGFSAEQKLPITYSPAYAIDGDSLKIGF